MKTAAKSAGIDTGIETLGDLMRFVAEDPSVPPGNRRYLLSAVNRAREFLSNGAADIRADPKLVLPQLDALSPAMAGMTPQSLANLKSRVRSAFRLATPSLPAARSHIRLIGAWAELYQAMGSRERIGLSRFMRFAQSNGWKPEDIGEQHLRRFEAYLKDEVVLRDADKVLRRTARTWNCITDLMPERQLGHLPVPPPKRQPYWIRVEDLPAGLQLEINDYLHRLSNPDPFLAGCSRPLAQGTILQHEIAFIQLASALVGSGTPIGQITSLQTLLSPRCVEAALRFHHHRAGDRVNQQILALAYRAYKIAQHIGGQSEEAIQDLAQICERVKQHAPDHRNMTEKNRRLLEHMEDPAFVDRLVTLPQRLMQHAHKCKHPRVGASYARDAVAVELLLTCGMRVGNLIDLQLGKTIRRYGEGADTLWIVELPAERVKNNQPLRFKLPPESGRMVELYLEKWHGHWCGPSEWLFPNQEGGHVDSRLLSNSIATRAQRLVGAYITCHQFRHLTAELYMREDPNGIGVLSQHLGHRDFNTTRRYYAREQSRVATQRYHDVLCRKRTAAPARARGRKSKTLKLEAR